METATVTRKLVPSSPTSKTATIPSLQLKFGDTVMGTTSTLKVTLYRTTAPDGTAQLSVTVKGNLPFAGYCVSGPDGQRFAVGLQNDAGGVIRKFVTDPMTVGPGTQPAQITGRLDGIPATEYTTMTYVEVVVRAATWEKC